MEGQGPPRRRNPTTLPGNFRGVVLFWLTGCFQTTVVMAVLRTHELPDLFEADINRLKRKVPAGMQPSQHRLVISEEGNGSMMRAYGDLNRQVPGATFGSNRMSIVLSEIVGAARSDNVVRGLWQSTGEGHPRGQRNEQNPSDTSIPRKG